MYFKILLISLCTGIGFGFSVLYHLGRVRQMRRNLSIQLNLLQNMPLGFVYVEKKHVLVNKTFCLELGGKKPSSWQGFLDMFPLSVQSVLIEKCDQLKQDKMPFEETILLEKRAFRVQAKLLADDTFILWWTDMTAPRKRVLKENQKNKVLLSQKDLLEKAWEALPFPAFIRGKGDKSLFANPAVGQGAKKLNSLHWVSRPFKMNDNTYTLTYGQETHTEEELQSVIREVAIAHQRLCQELPCAVCLFSSSGQMVSCSSAFATLWHLDENWIKTHPSYEDFWDAVQEKGLMNRVMDFAQYKKQQRGKFATLSETQEIFLYLPNGKVIRRLMIPFASGGVILLDEDKSA